MARFPIRFLLSPRGRSLLTNLQKATTSVQQITQNGVSSSTVSVEPRLRLKPPVGLKHAHQDDPEYFPFDKDLWGQENCPEFTYRAGREYPKHYGWFERGYTHLLSAFFWFWFFYHMYWDSGHILGEWYIPGLEEFTDEELGIPPDDAPDPEYWGYQQPHNSP